MDDATDGSHCPTKTTWVADIPNRNYRGSASARPGVGGMQAPTDRVTLPISRWSWTGSRTLY